MAGRSFSLDTSGAESTDLRIALYEMKEDVQRLEDELDAEREATATSASEAMSVILRLQGEKAMLAMEANQYKRIVEERMDHVELSLELLEDLNYQKEVKIKNLEIKLHAYRCKLMSLGWSGIDEEDYMGFCDRSQTPSPEPIDIVPVEKGVIEQSLDSRKDQIKKIDEQRDQYKSLNQESETKNGEKDLLVKKMAKRSSKQKRERSVKTDHAQGSCSTNDSEYQAELQQLKERIKRLERERSNTETAQTSGVKQEMMNRESEEDKLSSVPSAMLSYDSAIVSVQEAMLYFWL